MHVLEYGKIRFISFFVRCFFYLLPHVSLSSRITVIFSHFWFHAKRIQFTEIHLGLFLFLLPLFHFAIRFSKCICLVIGYECHWVWMPNAERRAPNAKCLFVYCLLCIENVLLCSCKSANNHQCNDCVESWVIIASTGTLLWINNYGGICSMNLQMERH